MSSNSELSQLKVVQTFAVDEEFTTIWVDVGYYDTIIVAINVSNNASVFVEFSTDGDVETPVVDSILSYRISPDRGEIHRLTVARRYMRLRVLNGDVGENDIKIQVLAGTQPPLTSNLNTQMSLNADAQIFRQIPPNFEIARGLIAGVSQSNKLGQNPDVDSGSVPEWVTSEGGVYSGFPTAADTLNVVSASANDASAGTGARTIRIIGLDANYEPLTEEVTLNGTTPVTTTGTFLRAHTCFVLTSGSGRINDGDISVTHTTSGNLFLRILDGIGGSNFAVYTVPAGKTGIITRIVCEASKQTAVALEGALYVGNESGSFRYRRPFSTSETNPHVEILTSGLRINEKTDLGIVILESSASNITVTGGFDITLFDNDL